MSTVMRLSGAVIVATMLLSGCEGNAPEPSTPADLSFFDDVREPDDIMADLNDAVADLGDILADLNTVLDPSPTATVPDTFPADVPLPNAALTDAVQTSTDHHLLTYAITDVSIGQTTVDQLVDLGYEELSAWTEDTTDIWVMKGPQWTVTVSVTDDPHAGTMLQYGTQPAN